MAIAVLVLLIGFGPLLFIDYIANLLNLSPETTAILMGPYLELLEAFVGIGK